MGKSRAISIFQISRACLVLGTNQTMEYLRTKEGFYALGDNLLGQFLYPIQDPEAVHDAPKAEEMFELNQSLPQIPKHLWGAMVNLFIHMAKNYTNPQEVQVRFLYNLEAQEGEMPWKIVVPRQVVSSGSVTSPNLQDCCDLITGAALSQYPPEGYVDAGSAHSHNTMSVSFSYTDDTTELRSQGIHFLIRSIKFSKTDNTTYVPEARISYRQNFYPLSFEQIKQVADLTPTDDTFDPKVLTYITVERFQGSRTKFSSNSYSGTKSSSNSKTDQLTPSSPQLNGASMGTWGSQDDYFLPSYGLTIEDELAYIIEDMSTTLAYTQSDIENIIQKHFKGWVRSSETNLVESSWESSAEFEEQLLSLGGNGCSQEIQDRLNSLICNLFDMGYTASVIEQAFTQFLSGPNDRLWGNLQSYEIEDAYNQVKAAYQSFESKEDQTIFCSEVEELLGQLRAAEVF